MALRPRRNEEPVKVQIKQGPVYKMTILLASDLDTEKELKPFYTNQVPKHNDRNVYSTRLWNFIVDIADRQDCYKTKYYSKAPKLFYNRSYMINFVELGTIENVPVELVNETMSSLETFYDGWALLKFDKHDKLAIHDNYKDEFVKIATGCLSNNIYIKYERV